MKPRKYMFATCSYLGDTLNVNILYNVFECVLILYARSRTTLCGLSKIKNFHRVKQIILLTKRGKLIQLFLCICERLVKLKIL